MIKITKIKEKANVYDLQIRDNSNFYASGILVHNCTFKDPSNIRYSNQHEGVVHSSNLCTEIVLHTKPTTFENNNDRQIKEYGETAVCNLGSFNLKEHTIVVNDIVQIDYVKLAETIKVGMRMLDNVIDINFYPTQEAKNSNVRHRPVGMGSMGWHDLFYALDINYDSQEAVDLSDHLYEFISLHTIMASSELAKERGKYSTYDGSLWSKNILPVDTYCKLMELRNIPVTISDRLHEWRDVRDHIAQYGMRNSNTMAIAPTATISNIVGCSSCTEPNYSNIFVASSMSGDFTIICEALVADLKKHNLWTHEMINDLKRVDGDVSQLKLPDEIKLYLAAKYKTALQQDQLKLIEAAAARGMWIDQAMSLNLFYQGTSMSRLSQMYMHAWKQGLKTTYYLRTRGASNIEKASVSPVKAPEQIISSIGDVEEPIKACAIDNPDCESCT